jgi:glycosyltransferase involved in cell wall biosynthesis
MRVKLLFVIDNLEFGGGERVFTQLINGLSSEHYEICLASNPGRDLYQSLINKEVCCIPLDFSKRVNPSLIFKLIKIIKDKKIDIVHGQGARAEFYARIAARLAGGTKYVSTIAMPVEGYDIGLLRKSIYFVLDRATERYVDRFIVVSDVLENTLIIKHHIPPEKVTKIYNGIEIAHYDSKTTASHRIRIRDGLGVNKDDILLGALGRMVWQKGFEFLIKCIQDVVKAHREIKVIIVGEGLLKKDLENLCRQLKVEDKTIFAGFRSDIKEILSAVDIVVIPSLLEGFPMLTLEAMAMAKPIVATRIDGITEQITDGVEGILVPPREPIALAAAINRIIENKEFARSLGLAARKRVEKEFTVEKMINETENVYHSLLD